MQPPIHTDAGKRHRRRMLVVLAVVLVVFGIAVGVNFAHRRDENPTPVTRKADAFLVDWRCLACGEIREQPGGIGPVACPKCGKHEMYVTARFACARHGAVRVAFQYDANLNIKEIKVADGPWVPQLDPANNRNNYLCPSCGAEMLPAELPRPRDAPSGGR